MKVVILMAAKYLVRPTSPARREVWQNLFGRDTLPIIDARPDKGQSGLVYHVDTAALTDRELSRLAGYVARQKAVGYKAAWDQVRTIGVSIPALGCELLPAGETAAGRDLRNVWVGEAV